MTAFLHALNISTMALWLSVGGFGMVGIVVPTAVGFVRQEQAEEPYSELEVSVWEEDSAANDLPAAQPSEPGAEAESEAPEEDPVLEEIESLPEPPELPDILETAPLPEVPDLPARTPEVTRPERKPRETTTTRRTTTPRRTTNTTRRAETRATTGSGGGSGMSDAKRLAGGRMPPPSYPSESRRKGQTGTVLVEFVVDANGRVVSAYAKRPSPWPLLNNAAVNAVRRWRFPAAGRTTKYIRPIVFQLR